MKDELKKLVDQWFRWDRNGITRSEIAALVEKDDEESLSKLLCTRMEFGTAGLRAAMGAGNSRMNELTVIQAAQGLASYLKEQFSVERLQKQGVVIGFDARHNSMRFARLSANVFLAAGFKTLLFEEFVCTPFVPFAVRLYGCVCGVMVTASHNPKQDNGYKVYWNNGAQIVPPHDSGIAKHIEDNLEPLESSYETQAGAEDPTEYVFDEYFKSLEPLSLRTRTGSAPQANPRFTYTAMHGVGTRFTTEAIRLFGVDLDDIVFVKEQVDPDPEFPTTPFPNPEEGKSALRLAMETADRHDSRVILANDPDADRLAVAEKQPNGVWKVFNGNQLGALFGWWALRCWKERRQGDSDLSNVVMLASTVSSKILKSMAKQEGFCFVETLTGFKWMGSRAEELQSVEGREVLFAFEEAIGFMFGTRVFDKDGVTAAAVMTDMVRYLEAEESGKLLTGKLRDIYTQYGLHVTYNSYVVSNDPAKTRAMFDSMRTLRDGTYPDVIDGVRVVSVRDLSVGTDTAEPDGIAALPTSTVSPMVTFRFENHVVLTIRGSGTEPKIKWYSEVVVPIEEEETVEATLTSFVNKAVELLMRPKHFGFAPRHA